METLEDREFRIGNKCQMLCSTALASAISSGVDTPQKLLDQQEAQ